MISKEDIRKQLPLRLREWFQNQNKWKTRVELSRHLGINIKTLDDYFNGRNHPKEENLNKLIEVTQIPFLIQFQKETNNKFSFSTQDKPKKAISNRHY